MANSATKPTKPTTEDPENAGGDGGGGDEVTPGLAAAIAKAVAEALKPINGELGNHRRSMKAIQAALGGGGDATPASGGGGEAAGRDASPAAKAVDVEAAVTAAMAIGELKGRLPAEVVSEIEEEHGSLSMAEKARIYAAAVKAHKRSTAANGETEGREPSTRAERPNTTPLGAPPGDRRTAAGRPKTRDEWLKLKPEERAALRKREPDFDASELPSE